MPATARILATALALCTARSAFADRSLTLDEALALARTSNRDLRVGRARLASAEVGIAQARVALSPTVAAQGRYTHNYKGVELDLSAFVPDAGPIVIQKEEQLDGGVTASVPLVAPAAWYGYAAATASARSSEASFAVTEANVLVGVAQAFYLAAGADELVVARTHGIQVATDTYKFAEARVGSDLANPVDVKRAEAALVRAQQDLVEAQNTQATAYRSLGTLLGSRETFRVQPATAAPADPAEDLAAHALARRPELAAERAAADAATASSRANAWKWSPTLSAFGNAHLYNYAGFTGDRYAWAIGLQLDWVIYDGGTRDAQRAVADAQLVEARAQLDLLHDAVSDEVANARGTLATKRKAVESATHTKDLASEVLRLTRAQYEAGTANQLDVLQAQDSLVLAEVALAQAHFDVSLADLQLRRAAGDFPGVSR